MSSAPAGQYNSATVLWTIGDIAENGSATLTVTAYLSDRHFWVTHPSTSSEGDGWRRFWATSD